MLCDTDGNGNAESAVEPVRDFTDTRSIALVRHVPEKCRMKPVVLTIPIHVHEVNWAP